MANVFIVDHAAIHRDWGPGRMEMVTLFDHLKAEARIAQLESALQLIGNELSLHADQGPAGEAFRALLNPTFGFPLEGGK